MTTEREEYLEDALREIAQWCNAYPSAVFVPLDEVKIKRAGRVLASAGIEIGALHAGWARHLLGNIGKIANGAIDGTHNRMRNEGEDRTL